MTDRAPLTDESCYCVCHSSFSSRAWCEHCKGDNEVNRVPRCGVPDASNANGTCARSLPCPVHHAPLTDEELAELAVPIPTGSMHSEDGVLLDQGAIHRGCEATKVRLIADLLASRAEVTQLKAENAQLEKWIPSGW